MGDPAIELLWWEGCPSTERARAELRAALDDVGLARARIVMREIRTDDEAGAQRFLGSPTILIDGLDAVGPAPGEDDEPVGLGCRVYHRRDGRIAPTPDPDDLRDALRRATRALEARNP